MASHLSHLHPMHHSGLDAANSTSMGVKPYRLLVTWIDDSAYYGLMVLVYDWTGVNRWFLPIASTLVNDPVYLQALRYGMMFGSMNELRRWLETTVSTDLSHYINLLLSHIGL